MKNNLSLLVITMVAVFLYSCSDDDNNSPETKDAVYSYSSEQLVRSSPLYKSMGKGTDVWLDNWGTENKEDTIINDPYSDNSLNLYPSHILKEASITFQANSDSLSLNGLYYKNERGNFEQSSQPFKVKYKLEGNDLLALADKSSDNWYKIGEKSKDAIILKTLYLDLWLGSAGQPETSNFIWDVAYLDNLSSQYTQNFNLDTLKKQLDEKGYLESSDMLSLYGKYKNNQMYWYIYELIFKLNNVK